MLEEEPQHLACRIRALGIRVRAVLAATGPRVPDAVHSPVLGHHASLRIAVQRAGVVAASLRVDFRRRDRAGARREDVFAVLSTAPEIAAGARA
jgi:hypothetical protein